MEEAVRVVNNKVTTKNKLLSLKQFINAAEEIYIHSLQRGDDIDEAYADWFIDLLES